MIELAQDEFEAVESGEAVYLVDRVTAVEIRQAGGLLNVERRAALVEGLSASMSYQLGSTIGGGPAIRVLLAREKEAQHG